MKVVPLTAAGRNSLLVVALSAIVVACGGGSSAPAVAEVPVLGPATPANFTGNCTTLPAALASLPNTTITSAVTVAAGTVSNVATAEHCQLIGRMNQRVSPIDGNPYYIGFEIRMPKAWNGRFFYQANGGTDGSISTAAGALGGGPITHALAKGFAVLSSDAGHQDRATPFFGLDPQARLDYGYNAVGQLTPMAKNLIKLVYGKAPDRSYLGGCSNGGRHALVASTRYADQYDGIMAGAPGYNLPKAAIAQLWGVQQYAQLATATVTSVATAAGVTSSVALPDVSTAFTSAELAVVSNAIVAKCDALDGATDGWVGDVAACQASFSVAADVPTCAGARDGTCLTPAQKTVLTDVHTGARNKAGAALYSSFPYDMGIRSSGWPAWKFVNSTGVGRDPGATAFIFTTAPLSNTTTFTGLPYALSFNFEIDAPKIFSTSGVYTESAMSFMTPPNPSDLSKLRDRGAKIMVYHGTADPVFSFDDTVAWYKAVANANSGDASKFARLFPVPGMSHCSGGPTTDQFDMIDPLVNWVEKGTPPASVTAAARGTGSSAIAGLVNAEVPATWSATRSRPLCPYPQVARYNGTGDKELASSFSCKI